MHMKKTMIIFIILLLSPTAHLCSQSPINVTNVTEDPLPMKGRYLIDSLIVVLRASGMTSADLATLRRKVLAFDGWTIKLDTMTKGISQVSVTRYTDGLFYNEDWGPFQENLHFRDL